MRCNITGYFQYVQLRLGAGIGGLDEGPTPGV